MLDIKEFTTRPRDVKAVRITEENMLEAAAWCNGVVIDGHTPSSSYISVKTHRPLNKRQQEGHVGDWLVLQGNTWKIYLDKPFQFGFEGKKGLAIQNTPLDLPFAPGAEEERSPIFEEISMVGLPKDPVPVSREQIPIDGDGDPNFVN